MHKCSQVSTALLDRIQREDDTVVVWLSLDPLASAQHRLLLVPRFESATISVACSPMSSGVRAVLPELGALGSGRWDFWLQVVSNETTDEPQRVLGAHDPERPRHFFCEYIGSYGISTYLTDSAQSLAMYIAPAETHKRVVATESAKCAFPGYLQDLPLIDNLVLFESFLGKTYAGNPRYIYEELLRTRPDLSFVWAYNGMEPIPGNPIIVRRGSADYYRWLAQAKYRVNNVIFPVHGKKAETIYLQTWHGTPLKRLSFDIEVSGPEVENRENFFRESRSWSLLLSENPHSTEVFKRAFRYEGPVLELGYPLTDPLVNHELQRDSLAQALDLPTGKKFVLYAPTWRDHKAIGFWQHEFDLQLDLEAVCAALGPDHVLLIKAHHLVSETLDKAHLPINAIDMSHLDDVNELCLLADTLITDYSSVLFDFAVTGRPILFYCYDLDLYASQIRGFYLDVHDDLPGPVVEMSTQLVELLGDLPKVVRDYAQRYSAFQQRFCSLNDGHVTQRVIRAVFGDGIGD